jgi:chloride channel protein, CIC family
MERERLVQRAHEGLLRYFRNSRTTGPLIMAAVVGIGAGLGALFFRWAIATAHAIFFGAADRWLPGLGPLRYVLPPAAGGLVFGPLIYFFAREAKGHGVPEVMLAVARAGGRIRPRVAVVKSLASALCIGSGGSVGREGPIVQIGSALGSTIGQALRLPDERMRLLVGCGAAGGIAATFNAPIAGALFALEVILRDFGARSFALVVIASSTATVIARATIGNVLAFPVPQYELRTAWELPLYLVLGGLCACVAVAFVKVLYAAEDVFDAWTRFPEWLKPVIGGTMVGLIGVVFPHVFGVGYETIGPALAGRLDAVLCAILIVMKIAATSLTIGSGGSGGVFAPSLFTGCMVGIAFGAGAHHFFPSVTAPAAAYALVGMGALFAGAARAPLTSILILFEMTGDYRIIVPLMIAAVTSALVSERLSRFDIYTSKLFRKGVDLTRVHPGDPLDTVSVAAAMTRDLDTVPATMTVAELAEKLSDTGHHGFPVVDEEGGLVGVVTLTDVANMAARGEREPLVGDIASSPPLVCYPDQTLCEALQEIGAVDVGRLPVVDRGDPRKLLGVLRRHDIIRAYTRAVAGLPLPGGEPPPPSSPEPG